MDIEIRRLTPGLAEEYLYFFDVTPHNVSNGGNKCYCVTWRSDDSYMGNNDHWFPSTEERRSKALQFVKSGSLQGYLAYQGDQIVGWCNANGDCRLCVQYLRNFWPIEEYPDGIRVKSIFCFVIAPEMQRKGIATRLVERVCADAAAEGFDYAEAYISRSLTDSDDAFRGPLTMFEKCGWTAYAEKEGRVVVRKALNQKNTEKSIS